MYTKEEAKEKVKELVERYKKWESEGKVKKLNEEQTKQYFITPLFHALGWDTNNLDEVSYEEKVSKGRADYSFKLNGITKFFLEAKAIKADLENRTLLEQAINYAWHKGVTWAILTDFEGLKIINAEFKESNPLFSIFRSFSWNNYIERFDELWLLSKQSFENGLLDHEAERLHKKIKKAPVDKQLLADFTRFREILSKSISKVNQTKDVNEEDLDEATQRVLDRLIFIRNCEDRGMESKTLISGIREWESRGRGKLVDELRKVFSYFDETYNSKIFAKHLCDQLEIENNVLYEIIEGLYNTKDRTLFYDFSAIEADVLGNIYEQYLGHILKKRSKSAKLTESKAHRKEQGIYYTPTYIVDYIVKNTVGELLKDKKVDANKIRILDPACGSGSFLIKAFDTMLNYHSKKDNGASQTKLDTETKDVTFSKKAEILKNNIFGVDLDKQAVEIAQLNLLLKIAEKGHKLPLLQQSIKNGNSLIDDPAIAGDKAFKWEEQFKEIIEGGGFDVTIGNPPYVNVYLLSKNEKEMEYYKLSYLSAYKKFDLYVLFIEKAIRLLKQGGIFSFIVPDKFLSQPYGLKLRQFILDSCKIIKIVDLTNYKIFEQATVDNVIIVLKKETNKSIRDNNLVKLVTPKTNPTIHQKIDENIKTIPQKVYLQEGEQLYRLDINPLKLKLKEKIEKSSIFVRDICYVNWGARSGDIKTFVIKEKRNELCKPMLDGRDINRYSIKYDNKYLIYDIKKLYNPMFKELFENPKIMIRDVNAKEGLKATFDDGKYYTEHTLSICLPFYELKSVQRRGLTLTESQIENSKQFEIKYLLAVLNSKLITFYFKTFIGCGLHVYPDNIRALPIKKVNLSNQKEATVLTDKMLSLNKRLNEIGDKKTDERAKIEEEIKKTDAEIDELVYKLYGITEEEKEIIEESLK